MVIIMTSYKSELKIGVPCLVMVREHPQNYTVLSACMPNLLLMSRFSVVANYDIE